MAKVKHTKNELKAQTEALKRYRRFLPMLLLKKQQLQAEIQSVTAKIENSLAESRAVQDGFNKWIRLFAEPVNVAEYIELKSVEVDEGNIAGVSIPVLKNAAIQKPEYSLFETPVWIDDAVEIMEKLIRLRVHQEILQEQRRLITEELRTTSQRVNLFEKVKIPQSKENIRVIKIFLGDEQTASVVRGKIAKGRE